MSARLQRQLGLSSMVKLMYRLSHSEANDNRFFQRVKEKLNNQFQLFRLHSIIKAEPNSEKQRSLIDDISLFEALDHFVGQVGRFASGLSDSAIEAIIELVKIRISVNRANKDIEDCEIEKTTSILGSIYDRITQSGKSKLMDKLLECLFVLRKKGDHIVDAEIYGQLLSKSFRHTHEFLDFFASYLRLHNPKESVIEVLFKGFSYHLSILLQGKSEDLLKNKKEIVDGFVNLVDFLERLPRDSIWLSILLREENKAIIDALLALTTKNISHFQLANVFNQLVKVQMRAEMSNTVKFEFVMKLYKFVIQKSSSFFTLVATNSLALDSDFLYWFMTCELSHAKVNTIIEVYLANQYTLEFLLVVMIYCLHEYPEKGKELGGVMRIVNLLQESKHFLTYESLRDYLRIFYRCIDEQDIFDDFYNRILDRATSLLI